MPLSGCVGPGFQPYGAGFKSINYAVLRSCASLGGAVLVGADRPSDPELVPVPVLSSGSGPNLQKGNAKPARRPFFGGLMMMMLLLLLGRSLRS